MKVLSILIFVWSVVLLLLSSLTIIQAPNATLCMIGTYLSATGPLISITLLPLLWPRLWRSGMGQFALLIGPIAVLLLWRPAIGAIFFVDEVVAMTEKSLGRSPDAQADQMRHKPFDLMDLLLFNKPEPVQPQRHIYSKNGSESLALDLYQVPGTQQNAPLIMVIPDTAWSHNQIDQAPDSLFYFTRQGYAVASITHRTLPEGSLADQLADVKQAVKYLIRHRKKLHLDVHRIVLYGRSSGAQLALRTAYDREAPKVRGVVAINPVSDLLAFWNDPVKPAVMPVHEILTPLLGGTPTEQAEAYRKGSPINAIQRSVPTLLVHAGRDDVVPAHHSHDLSDRLRIKQIEHMLIIIPWANHGFDTRFLGPASQILTYVSERFIAKVVR